MKTIYTKEVAPAAEILRQGGLCAVPTETVYGLAGNGLSPETVEEIYAVKDRPARKPLSLMVPDAGAFSRCGVEVPEAAYVLAEKFWPGPLTIVVKAAKNIPGVVLSGGDTVGLRCPDHPLTLALLRELDFPLAAPSANPSGAPSPKTEEEVGAYFDGKIGCILCGGKCGLGRESTIIDLSETPYRILRQGALPEADIFTALRDKMTILGFTGGTGCGKTTALGVVREMGGCVIDCDAVYHELLEDCAPMLAELKAAFPAAFTGDTLDRKALGRVVFADEEKLETLNRITHHYVRIRVEEILLDCCKNGVTLAAVDAIALIESGLSGKCRAVVAISAPLETRVKRLMARDGISEEYARLRIAAQKPEAFFRENSDVFLVNDGSEAAFLEKCRSAFAQIVSTRKE